MEKTHPLEADKALYALYNRNHAEPIKEDISSEQVSEEVNETIKEKEQEQEETFNEKE